MLKNFKNLREREALIDSLTTEEIFNQLGTRFKLDFNNSNHNMIKTKTNLYNIKVYSIDDIFDSINLGMNLNRTTSINQHEINQTVIHYDSLVIDEQYELAIECFNILTVNNLMEMLGDNEDFVSIADWTFNYLKEKWNY